MPKEPNIPFLKLIHKVFDPVFTKYRFAVQEKELWVQPERAVFARRGDVELGFRLGSSQLFWYFSLEIKLSGKLGKLATPDPRYRGLGVEVIAKCLDKDYKMNMKASQTEQELRERMESDKEELLKYCEPFLLGDVSKWQTVVDCLRTESPSET